MVDLLDIFVEAERLTAFTRFFTPSGTKEVRSRDALRPLLLLDLFAEGTNTGIKRVATANQRYGYDELLYVRKHYFSIDALRQANAAVVNKILALRNPRLWGEGSACASDGKRFESWRQNLMTEWRSRYKGYGVVVYWHVETNAVCLYSQLRNFSFSEVAAMIEGLIRHDTEMRVEKNFVDSHGQSEVAFAFCHLLGGVRLMPRLKRIKYERLYLPEPGMAGAFPHLAGVLSRPIRWDLIAQQYDEMVKHAVALKTGTASAEAILRRFNSYNVTHPTYKALAELGKVAKTIYLCEYLSSIDLRYEVQEGLNVVERWNEANDFLCYGRQGILATNSREQQEVTTLALQLLQNCLMLINTVLIEQTIAQHHLLDQLSAEDRRAPDAVILWLCQSLWVVRAEAGPAVVPRGRVMPPRLPPKAMAKKLVRVLRPQHPDYHYLKKVFQHTRELLAVGTAPLPKRLPALLTDVELVAFYEAIWQARQLTHAIMLKLLLFTGMRNAELVQLRPTRYRSADLSSACYPGQRPQGSRCALSDELPWRTRPVSGPPAGAGDAPISLSRIATDPTRLAASGSSSNTTRWRLGLRSGSIRISSGIS